MKEIIGVSGLNGGMYNLLKLSCYLPLYYNPYLKAGSLRSSSREICGACPSVSHEICLINIFKMNFRLTRTLLLCGTKAGDGLSRPERVQRLSPRELLFRQVPEIVLEYGTCVTQEQVQCGNTGVEVRNQNDGLS